MGVAGRPEVQLIPSCLVLRESLSKHCRPSAHLKGNNHAQNAMRFSSGFWKKISKYGSYAIFPVTNLNRRIRR